MAAAISSDAPTTYIRLKDGTDASTALIRFVIDKLRLLEERAPMILYDLVQKCWYPEYRFLPCAQGDPLETLIQCRLMDSEGRITDEIQRIVRSVTKSTGLVIKILDP